MPGRPLPDDRPSDQVVGVALSGGGIRSATFCLGVFQALARLGRLGSIDYLSTVSGGGYFGTFLGRLYRRREIQSSEQVRSLLDPVTPPTGRPAAMPDVVGWLRENGRYLSPNGSGDILLAASILFRNWVTIQIVVLSFALLVLVTGQLPRMILELLSTSTGEAGPFAVGCGASPCGPSWLWWSPWLIVPVVTLVFWAAPLAWAYWLTGVWRSRAKSEWPVWGVVMAGLVAVISAAVGLVIASQPSAELELWSKRLVWTGVAVLLVVCLSVVFWRVAQHQPQIDATAFPSPESRRVFEVDRRRNVLSANLRTALVSTGAFLAFALVDSCGQTLYLVGMRSEWRLFSYLGSSLAALAGGAAFAQRIATALAGRANGGRLRLPVAALVTTGALAVVVLTLVSLSILAHGVAWRFREPLGGPAISWARPAPSRATINVQIPETSGVITATTVLEAAGNETRPAQCLATGGPCPRSPGDFGVVVIVWAILVGFALAFGRCWPFINQSSLHSMYSARLTRAYLGASNPRRLGSGGGRITQVEPGDNIDPTDYWPAPGAVDAKGRPLHLINVTVNETVDGKSNVQRQDRKGTGLAIGPCAFSVGIRHHAIFPSHEVLKPAVSPAAARSGAVSVFPESRPGTSGPGYRVFGDPEGQGWLGGERLSVGAWTGISGAAFSTGLGARTNLGLSLLCGLANVRLGYWWDSGVDPRSRPERRRRWSLGVKAFPVQSYLLSEFVSRFYGTSRKHWYLSDGGHFENMGAYELIRRRIARIVLIDAEADPDYTFDGLANLIRKARVDFGAEIQFLNEREVLNLVPDSHRRLFGTLQQLRRGKWSQEPVNERRTDQPRLSVDEPVDEGRHSLAHAALARVTFSDDSDWLGWLLYVKPTLIGDEPADLVQYHQGHLHFPQETTADQFFDEAQWESYRMLGYHIAHGVFGAGLPGPPPVTDTGAAPAPPIPTPAARIFGT